MFQPSFFVPVTLRVKEGKLSVLSVVTGVDNSLLLVGARLLVLVAQQVVDGLDGIEGA